MTFTYLLLLLGACAFLFSLLLTPICRDFFSERRLVDETDRFRKIHAKAIPRVGGIPIVLAYLLSYGVLYLCQLQAWLPTSQLTSLLWQVLPAAGLVFVIGLLDDLFGLKPWHKLAAQIVSAGWVYWEGVRVVGLAGYSTENWWSLPLTVLWLIGCTNAFNLIDGVDGLASGLGLLAILTMIVAALLQDNVALAIATVPLAGAVLAFLRYNFNPATIFLGDSGSLLIGFLLGCYGIIWSQKSATLLAMTAPLMVLAIPLLDVCLTIVRRLLRHKPIFGADRGHIHHQLLDRGLTPRGVALLLYGVSGLFAAFSLLSSVVQNHYSGVIVVLFCAVAWVGIHNLGYAEFTLARRMLLAGEFPRMLNAELSLRKFEVALAATTSVEDCWSALRAACPDFGFVHVELGLGGQVYQSQVYQGPPAGSTTGGFSPTGSPACWQLRVPLSGLDYVQFTREFQCAVFPMILASFVDVVRSTLASKLEQLEGQGLESTLSASSRARTAITSVGSFS